MTMMATSAAVSMRWLAVSPESCCWIRWIWFFTKSIAQPSLAKTNDKHAERQHAAPPRIIPHRELHRDSLDLFVRVHQLGADGEQGLEREVGFLHRGHDAGHVFGLAGRQVLDGLAGVLLELCDFVDAFFEHVGKARPAGSAVVARGFGCRAGSVGEFSEREVVAHAVDHLTHAISRRVEL